MTSRDTLLAFESASLDPRRDMRGSRARDRRPGTRRAAGVFPDSGRLARRALAWPLVAAFGLALGAEAQSYSTSTVATGSLSEGIAQGDFDGDGDLDALVAVPGIGGRASLLSGNGSGGFTASNVTLGNPQLYDSVAAGDVDLDGDLDAVFGSRAAAYVSVMINNGGGGFSSGQLLNVNPNPPEQVALADLDVDGDLDLVLVDRQNSRIRPYLGNGLGTFTATTVQTVNQQPRDVAVADLNKDGDPDLVTANSGTTQVTVLLGAAGATFTRTDYSVGLQTHAVGIGDLDGDGNLDIVAASQFNNRFARILGNGLGGFGSASNFLSGGTGPADLLVSDFDADGNLDVAVVHLNTSNLGISLGNGNGTFQAATSYASGATMGAAMVAGDIDLSGRQDLLLTFAGSGNVAVFRETTPTPGGLVAFGTGTGGCEGRLGINASEAPRINRPNFHLLTSNGPPHDAVAAFFTGNADPGTLVYGALFHVSFTGLVSYPTVSDEAGYASYNLPIPNNPALLGLSLSFQGVFIEPVANRCSPSSLGIVTSVGMTATIF